MFGKSAVAVAALFVLTAGSASAATYYVSNSGSDANNGGISTPFLTIGKAAGVAKAGDIVNVRAGVYGKSSISSVGTASAHVTFQSYAGETAVIDGTGTAAGTDLLTLASASYVDVIGFEVRNATKIGITIWGCSNVRILNCNVHHNTRNGIYAGASAMGGNTNITVDGNNVHDNVLENQYNTMTGGGWASSLTLAMTNGGSITNNSVHNNHGEGIDTILSNNCAMRGNTVYDNYSCNIYIDNARFGTIDRNFVYTTGDSSFFRSGYPASGIQVANETYSNGSNPVSDVTITNNIVIGGRWGFYYGNYETGGGLKNFTIANNTFYKAAQTLLSIDSSAHSGTVIENNIFDQIGNVMTYVPSTSGLTFRNNNWYGGNAGSAAGAGDILADPRLSNPNGLTAADYKLTSATPLLNTGVSLSAVGTDFFGAARSTVNDIGAHQLSGSVVLDTQAPTVPASLSVASVTTSSVSLSWNASTDNVAVAGYNVYRNGVKVASVSGTTWTDAAAAQSVGTQTTYSYQIAAYDAAGNVSALSSILTAGPSPVQMASGGSSPATPAPTMPTTTKRRSAGH